MAETPQFGSRLAAPGNSKLNRRLLPALVTWGILTSLALAVLLLRFPNLSELPPGLLLDEGIHGANALQVLRGEHTVFFPEQDDGLEGLMAYAVAATTHLLGRTVLALRLPAALASAGTVFVTFWLGYVLFQEAEPVRKPAQWRSLFIGGVGAGLVAVSLGQTIIGRTALRANFLPFVLSLCFVLLWTAWRKRSFWLTVAAGVCAGVLPYTYIAARFVPVLFFLFGLSFLPYLSSFTDETHWKKVLRRQLWRICLFLGVTVIVAAPILVYFVHHPEHFLARTSQVSVFHPSRSQGDPLRVLLLNVWEHLLSFGILGDRYWRYNFPGKPMLSLGEALLFWLGVGISIWHWRRPANRLLLLWLVVLIMPAMLSRDSVPHTLRMIGATPSIYLLAAFGAWETYRSIQVWFLPRIKNWVTVALVGLVPVLFLFKGLDTHHTYFQEWGAQPELRNSFEVEWTDLIQYLNEQPPSVDTIYLIPDGQRRMHLAEGYQNYIFEYLYQNTTPVFLFHSAMPELAERIWTTLHSLKEGSRANIVEWDFEPAWTGDEDERIAVLFDKYARLEGSERFGTFRVHSFTEIDVEHTWTFYERPEQLKVEYDGGIELHGAAFGQGRNQFLPGDTFNVRRTPDFWVALEWITGPDLEINYAVSLRLHDTEGTSVYQMDTVIWKPDHTLTGSGGPSTLFDSLFHLRLPSELPPGVYELRLIIYDSETLKPTVELGVWEPERTLARLNLAPVD